MAFAIKAASTSHLTFSPAVHRPSSSLTTPAASVTKIPAGRKKSAAVTRAVAAVAPPPAPAPARPAGKRCLSVSQTMSRLKAQGKTAFIPYITAGDPDLATTAEALRLLDACGADVIELGMPFSDPYADGPVIQASAARALASGTTTDGLLAMLKEVTDKPVAVGFGISKPEHVKQIAEWGADGVIIGSAMVRQLGEATSPQEGLKRLGDYARSMKNALPGSKD